MDVGPETSATVSVTGAAQAAIVAHAVACAPLEGCGLLAGPVGTTVIDRFRPVANAARSPTRFVLDPAAMLACELDLDAEDAEIRAVMHSHPTTAAEPSATDIDDWSRFDPAGTWMCAIVSLADTPPVTGWYRITSGDVETLTVREA